MNQEVVLPKNIRQIGEIQQERKVYLEDYVMTYIRKKEKEETEGCIGLLYGKKCEEEGCSYLFLTGALLLCRGREDTVCWKTREEEKAEFFPDQELWGYFLVGTPGEEQLEELNERLNNEPVLVFHLQEGEEAVYWAENQQYQRMKGYFIFYERNPGMQKYISETSENKGAEEEGVEDRAILSFREKIREKAQNRKGSGRRYLAGSFLILTIFMLGITIVNGYDRIKSMETLMAGISSRQTEVGDRTTMSERETENRMAASQSVQATEYDATEIEQRREGPAEKAEVQAEEAQEEGVREAIQTEEDGKPAEKTQTVSASAAEQFLAERNYSAETLLSIQGGREDEILEAARRQSQSVYTIKYGDTLADISQKYYGNLNMVQEICERNQIEDANLILPGQKIVLP